MPKSTPRRELVIPFRFVLAAVVAAGALLAGCTTAPSSTRSVERPSAVCGATDLLAEQALGVGAVVDPATGCASPAPPPASPSAALASLIIRIPAAHQAGYPTPHDGADRAATVAVAGGTAELQVYPSIAATGRYLDTWGSRHPTHTLYLQFGPWWTATTTDLDAIEVIADRLGGTTNRLSP